MAHTSISDVEQHGHKDVVHQVQSDAVSKQGIPHHQQVLEWELAAEQQTYPPAARHKGTEREKEGNCICVQLRVKVSDALSYRCKY